MALYLGTTKLTGTGVQVDDALSSTSQNPVQNKVITEALADAGYNEWVKPADWVDIRSGAKENSVSLLVAHSTPTESGGTYTVATYPELHVTCSTSSGTYDVFVDGIKVATTNSGTKTVLDWGALYTAGTIISGFNVTHPSEFVTHIVRFTPTDLTDTLTLFRNFPDSSHVQQGILWAHFQLSNPISIASGFGGESRPRNLLLEAVTAKNNKITYTISTANPGFYALFAYCEKLVQIPVLEANDRNTASGVFLAFRNVPANKVIIKNNKGDEDLNFIRGTLVSRFEIENGVSLGSGTGSSNNASDAANLKQLPSISMGNENIIVSGLPALTDTFIDDTSATGRKLFRFNGTSQIPLRGLKGLIVSNQAPFDGASPQINVSYTGMDRMALVNLFNSLPTASASQVCNVTGATGADDLTASDLAIATGKNWTITR